MISPLFRHLAIRRYIWECDTDTLFNKSDAPTVSDFIMYSKNDIFELSKLIENILINTQNKKRLKDCLVNCDVDINKLIEKIEALNQFDSKRYSVVMSEIKLFANF